MTALVLRGDARTLPLPDASVDLIVTSPPYWSLRSYTDGGQHYDGQIGAEQTPWDYLDALWECTQEWIRVLKPEGSLWINLGDKYSTYEGPRTVRAPAGSLNARLADASQESARQHTRSAPDAYGVPYKSLMGLPWRYAIGCVDNLGLTLRAEVIWDKPNGLPESVTDRVRRSHEQWFHLVKQPRYYSAVDEIREPHAPDSLRRSKLGARSMKARNASIDGGATAYAGGNPLGALPGSVWEIATQPLRVPVELQADHFAAFPMEWPRRLILGWSPHGICIECGDGRHPVRDSSEKVLHRPSGAANLGKAMAEDASRTRRSANNVLSVHKITGYACACPAPDAPTRPAVVLDPFGGTGTTALIASTLGRRGVTVDRSADYCRIAQWRTTDPGERARALGLPKPPLPVTGQDSLFEELVT
ncbi:MAG: methylase domain protein [Nocardioides sp.]|nr:methylase domain protein [Nocardioides sp.]